MEDGVLRLSDFHLRLGQVKQSDAQAVVVHVELSRACLCPLSHLGDASLDQLNQFGQKLEHSGIVVDRTFNPDFLVKVEDLGIDVLEFAQVLIPRLHVLEELFSERVLVALVMNEDEDLSELNQEIVHLVAAHAVKFFQAVKGFAEHLTNILSSLLLRCVVQQNQVLNEESHIHGLQLHFFVSV